MQVLAWILRLLILLVLVWFAVRNAQEVELRGFPEQSWKAPLVFVLLLTFVGGVVIGVLAWLPTVVRQRREIARMKGAAAVPGLPASPPVPERVTALPEDIHGV